MSPSSGLFLKFMTRYHSYVAVALVVAAVVAFAFFIRVDPAVQAVWPSIILLSGAVTAWVAWRPNGPAARRVAATESASSRPLPAGAAWPPLVSAIIFGSLSVLWAVLLYVEATKADPSESMIAVFGIGLVAFAANTIQAVLPNGQVRRDHREAVLRNALPPPPPGTPTA